MSLLTDSGWWNMNVIRDLFTPTEAEAICSLVVSPLGQPDKLVWTGTTNGCFSVRSSYHLEMSSRAQERGECSSVQERTKVLKHVWKLKTTGVVKNFLWKLCSNALPTKDLLLRRHIVSDSTCPMCLTNPEIAWHMLWSCPAVVSVWLECSRRLQKLSLGESDGKGWLMCM